MTLADAVKYGMKTQQTRKQLRETVRREVASEESRTENLSKRQEKGVKNISS